MLRIIIVVGVSAVITTGADEFAHKWDGKWFPNLPNADDTNPTIIDNQYDLSDSKHGIKMGIKDSFCDDGETNLILDWLNNPENYTCLEPKQNYLPSSYIHPLHTIERIPPYYNAPHACMNDSIHYSEIIPTFGTHRPLWPIFGEYQFVPKQRWIHSLEHGAVVMLYHPCAEKNEVKLLKTIVKNCLYKHVITPYNLLEPKRPIVLVTWGHRLEMSRVAPDLAIKFIRDHALHGPETVTRNGQYSLALIEKANIISDINDSKLCPDDNDIINKMK